MSNPSEANQSEQVGPTSKLLDYFFFKEVIKWYILLS